jgi:hypothetical protein
MTVERIVALTRTLSLINPAATQRQVQALTPQLLTLATSKATPHRQHKPGAGKAYDVPVRRA